MFVYCKTPLTQTTAVQRAVEFVKSCLLVVAFTEKAQKVDRPYKCLFLCLFVLKMQGIPKSKGTLDFQSETRQSQMRLHSSAIIISYLLVKQTAIAKYTHYDAKNTKNKQRERVISADR